MLGLGIAKKIGLGNVVTNLIRAIKKYRFKKQNKVNKEVVSKRRKEKIFVVGFNKTGTTSLGYTLEKFGYIVGNQMQGELLFNDWVDKNFDKIIEYCDTAEVFQDIPFSFPETFKHMDKAFPGSKFILTLRNNPEQWHESLINFHGKMWGNGNIPPTGDDLKNANYIYKGFPLESITKLYNTDEVKPYSKKILINKYIQHEKDVLSYFKNRSEDLLVINISEEKDFGKLCTFLNAKTNLKSFPHISSIDIAKQDHDCGFLKPI